MILIFLSSRHAIHERIPVWLLAVLVGLVPIVIFALIGLGISRSFWDFHGKFYILVALSMLNFSSVATLGLILSEAITWVIQAYPYAIHYLTSILGRHRRN